VIHLDLFLHSLQKGEREGEEGRKVRSEGDREGDREREGGGEGRNERHRRERGREG